MLIKKAEWKNKYDQSWKKIQIKKIPFIKMVGFWWLFFILKCMMTILYEWNMHTGFSLKEILL